jgi:uncharacterized protein (TIGR02453 family)
MLQPATLKFLRDLKVSNHKEWFEANRKKYEAAKEDFALLVTDLIGKHGKKDETIAALTVKDCTFRINRDVRFSKDKSPYKTNFGASFNKSKKKGFFAGYYVHIEPGNNSFAGGGIWMPEADFVKKIRQEVDYNRKEFEGIVKSKKFVAQFEDLDKSAESSLIREPKGYEKDNPAIEYLKLKSWVAMRPLTDEDVTGKDLSKKILAAFEALQPMVYFLNRAIEE